MEVEEAWIPQSKPQSGATPGYAPAASGGFLDISREGSRSLNWATVPKLDPLVPPPTPTGRGMLRYRTNSEFIRKYRSGRRCMIEACVFATGWDASPLNLLGFTGSIYARGIDLSEINMRFQDPEHGPPFELARVRQDGSTCGGAGGRRRRGNKRASDGSERRHDWSLFELLSLREGIFIAVAQVHLDDGPADGHAIVWDWWRRILFLGPGDFNDHVCDGAIQVEESDLQDPGHLSDVYIGPERVHRRMTLSDYVREIFGISRVTKVAALMVQAKRIHLTEYV